MRDMISNKQAVFLGTVTVDSATEVASSFVDVRGFDACTLILKTNTVTAAGTGGVTVTAQHGDDTTGAGAADIVAADAIGGTISLAIDADGDDDQIIGGIGYAGGKRYVRMNFAGAADTDLTADVYAILNKPHRAATSFVGTAVSAT